MMSLVACSRVDQDRTSSRSVESDENALRLGRILGVAAWAISKGALSGSHCDLGPAYVNNPD